MTKISQRFNGRFATSYITKLAILTALSFVLYYYAKFPLPMLFPSFLDIQFSELPALLAGFSMGPFSAVLVIVLKCCMKMPFSGTSLVGELIDIVIGCSLVLPPSLIYKKFKNKKGALVGLLIGVGLSTVVAIIANRFVAIPFYIKFFFGGQWGGLLGMCSTVYPGVTKENFYSIYLSAGVLPFNLLRGSIVCILTFLLYKRLSPILHWDGKPIKHKSAKTCAAPTPDLLGVPDKTFDFAAGNSIITRSAEETENFAAAIGARLEGGEMLILNGDLGAGKTTFTKGLARALGVDKTVTSPTFTLVKEYEGEKLKLYHIDMYRLASEDECSELGISEMRGADSVVVIEWNKISEPEGKTITVNFEVIGENERKLTVSGL